MKNIPERNVYILRWQEASLMRHTLSNMYFFAAGDTSENFFFPYTPVSLQAFRIKYYNVIVAYAHGCNELFLAQQQSYYNTYMKLILFGILFVRKVLLYSANNIGFYNTFLITTLNTVGLLWNIITIMGLWECLAHSCWLWRHKSHIPWMSGIQKCLWV